MQDIHCPRLGGRLYVADVGPALDNEAAGTFFLWQANAAQRGGAGI